MNKTTDAPATDLAGEPTAPVNPYADVERLRKASRMQVDACARALGVSPALWSSLEKKGVPTPEEMKAAILAASEAEKSRVAELLKG